MSLPTVEEVRSRIEKIASDPIRLCLKFTLLAAARVSEAVGNASPSDNQARGPTGRDVSIVQYKDQEEAALFTVRTSKRDGLERIIALPINKTYEPWTTQLLGYFEKFGEDLVFPFTRQRVWRYSRDVFDGLLYPIEEYVLTNRGVKIKVNRHSKPFGTHALRHERITELMKYYGFSELDTCRYAGWKMGGGFRGGQLHRYAHLNWQEYFPKLLKKRY